MAMPEAVRIALIEALADVEHRLAFGTSERLQVTSVMQIFTCAMHSAPVLIMIQCLFYCSAGLARGRVWGGARGHSGCRGVI